MAHGELGTAGVADEVGQREVCLLAFKLKHRRKHSKLVFSNFGINVPMYAIYEAIQKRHLSRRPGPLAQLGVVPAPGVVGVDPRGHNVVEPE